MNLSQIRDKLLRKKNELPVATKSVAAARPTD
jgi:hypothetical protein